MKKVNCPKCSYEWKTKSEKIYVTCPNCQRKFILNDLKGGIIRQDEKI